MRWIALLLMVVLSPGAAWAQGPGPTSPIAPTASPEVPVGTPAGAPGLAIGAPAFRVTFVPADKEQSFVIAVDEGRTLFCRAPCELTIAAGAHQVHVSGDASFDQELIVDRPMAMRVEKLKVGRLVLGIVSVSVGATVALLGADLALVSAGDSNSSAPQFSAGTDSALAAVGITSVIVGTALGVAGGIYGFTTVGHTQLAPAASGDSSGAAPSSVRLIGFGVGPAANRGLTASALLSF